MAFFTADEIAFFNSGKPIRCAFLFEMDFKSGKKGAWNGARELTVNGVVFKPMFGAGSLEGLSFENSTVSRNTTIKVSGVRNDVLGLALSEAEEVQQQYLKIYLQMFDEEWKPIAAPPAIGIWLMQAPEVTQDEVSQDSDTSPSQTISISAENIWFNRSRSPAGRYTDRDQQILHPGDDFFKFVPSLVFKTFPYPDF